MSIDRDADLRGRFAGLRDHDHASAPSFGSVLARRAVPRRSWSSVAAGAAALAIVSFVAVRAWSPKDTAAGAAAPLPPWPTQTDSLLAGAGADALHDGWLRSPTSRLGSTSSNYSLEKP